MKYFILILFSLNLCAAYASDSQPLLTEEEFKSLPREKQGEYIRTVQKILAQMAKKTLFMATNEQISASGSRSPASESGTLLVTDPAPSLKGKNPEKKGPSRLDAILTDKYGGSEDTFIASGASAGNTQSATPFASEPRQGKKNSNQNPIVSPPAVSPPTAPAAAASAAPQVTTEPAPAPQATKPPAQRSSEPVSNSEPKAKVKEEVKPEVKSTPKETGSFRCMYSGWVIKTDPCSGPTQFPEGFSIEGVDKKKMLCKKGQTMCNPTVFGLILPPNCDKFEKCKNEAQPRCVARGAWPTETCYNESSMKEALVAADLMNLNSTLYSQFSTDLKNLCDKDQIAKNTFADPEKRKSNKQITAEGVRHDIEVTCKWAYKHLELAKAALQIQSKGGDSAEAKTKWQQDKSKSGDEYKSQKEIKSQK